MTRAAGEAFRSLRPGQRTLLYSRSSFIGSHRYGDIWLFWPEASPQLFSIFQRLALPFSSRLTPQNIMQWFMVLSRVSRRSALVMPKVRPPSTSPYWKQSGSQ